MRILLSIFILLAGACERNELPGQHKDAGRLSLDAQIKLCKTQDIGNAGKCVENAGWIYLTMFGYAKDRETAAAFREIDEKCGLENGKNSREYNMDAHKACIERAGWQNTPNDGWIQPGAR